jgi:transposase
LSSFEISSFILPRKFYLYSPILSGRITAGFERHVRQLAKEDPVCRRLMSMPGIGAVVALTYRSAVDDPARFTSSKKVGPWVGLTPSRNQSGERYISGGITKAGDVSLRRALCEAATVMMHRGRANG